MQDIYDLISAIKDGRFWAAIRIAFKILNEYKDLLPVDGQPQPMRASADTVEGLVAELEFQSAQPVAAGVQAAAVPWGNIVSLLLKLLPLLFQKT